ncbi:AAA family ATPase [Enterococcus casseliflavus]|nr:AAA family ATPase [Enterococcus casseliflavus]
MMNLKNQTILFIISFLELLEDGKFTDSLGREFDLSGYIIIFTSNVKQDNELDFSLLN